MLSRPIYCGVPQRKKSVFRPEMEARTREHRGHKGGKNVGFDRGRTELGRPSGVGIGCSLSKKKMNIRPVFTAKPLIMRLLSARA